MMTIWGLALAAWLFYLVFVFPFKTNSDLTEIKKQLAKLKQQQPDTTPHPKPTSIATTQSASKQPNYEQAKIITPEVKAPPLKAIPFKPKENLERQLGTRLPVWVGGISLVFAGFYMVQYSIERGLLSPAVRLSISSIFGGLLLMASFWILAKPKFSNGARIAQALAGAGIAILYLSIYAATSMYNFLPPWAGFSGMAAITVLSMVLALAHGAPIALIGLISGFLTPLLIKGEPNTPTFLVYLYTLLLGSFYVIRKNDWWWLAATAIFGAFAWVFAWSCIYPIIDNSLYLGLFVIAVLGTFITICNDNTPKSIKYLTITGSLLLLAYFTASTNYGYQEWGMFGILAMGSIILAICNPKTYMPFPWIAMLLSAAMIAHWSSAEFIFELWVICISGALFTFSAFIMAWRNLSANINWMLLSAAANVIFFVLAYFNLHLASSITSSAAFAFAVFWAFTTKLLVTKNDMLFSIACVAATTFLSIGAMILLTTEYYAMVFAAELLVISWLNTKVTANIFGDLALVLTIIIIGLLGNQFLTHYNSFAAQPFMYLGLSAIALTLASILFRGRIEDSRIQLIEYLSAILFALMGPLVLQNLATEYNRFITIDQQYLLEGLYDNYYMLLGLAYLVLLGQAYQRAACSFAGLLLVLFACFGIIFTNSLINNPITNNIAIGSMPIFNSLLLVYVCPALWLILADKILKPTMDKHLVDIRPLAVLFIFLAISFNVRQYFHGTYLSAGETSNMEIYSYSIAWLTFGILLLVLGTMMKAKQLRVASLVLLILTVSKVFLYDAQALTGILRVFSFLGLGMCLIGISWLYARFVFRK